MMRDLGSVGPLVEGCGPAPSGAITSTPLHDAGLSEAIADLRAKLAGPDPREDVFQVVINIPVRHVQFWPTRRDADLALRGLRERGLNAEKGVFAMRARHQGRKSYVITRLGEFGETMLMTADGSWVPGLLYPQRPVDRGSIWVPYDGAALEPPMFTHVTSTAPVAGRTERYKTKSNGSCGRWVWSDDSVARCTCTWKAYGATRAEAQAAARAHRFDVRQAGGEVR